MRMGAMNKFMRKNSRTTELSKVIIPLIKARPMTRSEISKGTGLSIEWVYTWVDNITLHALVWEDDRGRIGILKWKHLEVQNEN